MKIHQYFDLVLHETAELEGLVGQPIRERVTLSDWPLSHVERLELADGGRIIYKSSHEPTLEDQFYAAATSPCLPRVQTIHREGPYCCLLIEAIDAPLLKEMGLSGAMALQAGREVCTQIRRIEGELPCLRGISSREHWNALAGEMTAGLSQLLADKVFVQVGEAEIETITGLAISPDVQEIFAGETGYLHNDLIGDNVFRTPDGYRIIDWQRPIAGPLVLDLVTLLSSLGVNPLEHLPRGAVLLSQLLKIEWFTQCALKWFPAGVKDYDRMIARMVASHASLSQLET